MSSFPCDDDDGVDLKPLASKRSFQYISLSRLRTGLFFFMFIYHTVLFSSVFSCVFSLGFFFFNCSFFVFAYFNVLSFLKKR